MVGWVKATPFFGAFVKFRTIIEAGFGVGITENIVQAYSEIVRRYRPGDRIYLVGFSRGAYTARCVAGVIRRCGLLRAEKSATRTTSCGCFACGAPDRNVPIHRSYVHEELPAVEFLGLFDTVGSLGVPMWGWWFNSLKFFRNTSAVDRTLTDLRQRLPRDGDGRAPRPVLPDAVRQEDSREFLDHDPGRSLVPRRPLRRRRRLRRCGPVRHRPEMDAGACMKHGLVFDPACWRQLRPNALAPMHDELQRQPAWRLLGSWPRWHPVCGPAASQCGGARLGIDGQSGPS